MLRDGGNDSKSRDGCDIADNSHWFLGTDSSKWGQHFHSLAKHILADSDGELLFDVQEHEITYSHFYIISYCAVIDLCYVMCFL